MKTLAQYLKRALAAAGRRAPTGAAAVAEAIEGRWLMSGDLLAVRDAAGCSNNLYLGSLTATYSPPAGADAGGGGTLTDTAGPDYVGATDIWRAP
jgi:hypothetical protein